MDRVFECARRRGCLSRTDGASVDSTGLESSYISRYFLKRQDRRVKRALPYIKLSVLTHHETHLIAAATVRRGPSNDATECPLLIRQAAARLNIETFMGDAAYDAEPFHVLARRLLGARETIIPVNSRGYRGPPKTRYRRSMHDDFPRSRYGQRWQTESTISQLKRLLEDHLHARSEQGRYNETYFRVLTLNLMILLRRHYTHAFYRAG